MPEGPYWRRRVCLVAGTVLATLFLSCGCGLRAPGGPQSGTPSSHPSGSFAPIAATGPKLPVPGETATYAWRQGQQDVAAVQAVLAWHEYHLPRGLAVYGYTDRLAALIHQAQAYPYYSVYLLDLDRGGLRQVLAKPMNAARGYLIMEVRLSDKWMVWEELSPGDDLANPAHWYLYAAPVHAKDLTIGKPLLVDKGYTPRRSRPLWEVSGDLVAWNVNEGPRRDPRGFLGVTNLASHRRLFVKRSPGRLPFPTVGLADGKVWVSELCRRGRYPLHVRVYAVAGGRQLAIVALHNRHLLEKLVAMHGRWLAWALAWSGETAGSDLYALKWPGSLHLVARSAIEPCFVGHYLFFQVSGAEMSGIDGLELGSQTRFRVARTTIDTEGSWMLGMHAGTTNRTLVMDNPFFQDLQGDTPNQYSPVRVYRIQPQKEAW
jgi:hypothetical protein